MARAAIKKNKNAGIGTRRHQAILFDGTCAQ
jgi:hypothetical protein